MKQLLKSRLVVLLVLALVLTACGGGDGDAQDGGGGSDTPAATEAPATPTDDANTSDADDDDQGAAATTVPPVEDLQEFLGDGVATVTLNGETYHFGDAGFPAIQCMPDFFGVMLGVLEMVDEDGNAVDGGGSVQFALLHEGTDPEIVDTTNELVVKIETGDVDQEWTADEGRYEDREILDGSSQVDSVTFNGNTATGTASVYDDEAYWGAGGDPDAVPTATAEFEITCSDE